MIFDLQTKHVIKGALPEIKKKKYNLTCETNPSEKPSIKNKPLTNTKEQSQDEIFRNTTITTLKTF